MDTFVYNIVIFLWILSFNIVKGAVTYQGCHQVSGSIVRLTPHGVMDVPMCISTCNNTTQEFMLLLYNHNITCYCASSNDTTQERTECQLCEATYYCGQIAGVYGFYHINGTGTITSPGKQNEGNKQGAVGVIVGIVVTLVVLVVVAVGVTWYCKKKNFCNFKMIYDESSLGRSSRNSDDHDSVSVISDTIISNEHNVETESLEEISHGVRPETVLTTRNGPHILLVHAQNDESDALGLPRRNQRPPTGYIRPAWYNDDFLS